MAKKILILCDAFTPPAYLPRIVNLCKNLNRSEWEPYIFTEKMVDINYTSDICPIYQMPYYKSKNKQYWAYKWLLNFIFQKKDSNLEKFIKSYINISDFQLIMCSSFNVFPQTAASKLAKEYNLPLIIDLRDITEQWNKTNYSQFSSNSKNFNQLLQNYIDRINIRRRNKALRQANAISTVSPWHSTFLTAINNNTHLIYNGYDADQFYPQQIVSTTFDITYTGRIYDLEFRNPNLLFEAIKQLDSEGVITADKIQIKWYIDEPSQNKLSSLIKNYNIQSYNQIHNFVSSNQIPTILNQSSVNLILTAKDSGHGPHGIMTTKFFEALGVEKPILCVRSDEGYLAKTIHETKAGLAAVNVEEVKEFILNYYKQWKQNGYTRVNIEHKEQFSRQNQALQFEEIFNNIIK